MVTVLGNKELRQNNEAFSVRHVETLPIRQCTCQSSQHAQCYCSLIFCLLNGRVNRRTADSSGLSGHDNTQKAGQTSGFWWNCLEMKEVKPWPLVQAPQLTVISSGCMQGWEPTNPIWFFGGLWYVRHYRVFYSGFPSKTFRTLESLNVQSGHFVEKDWKGKRRKKWKWVRKRSYGKMEANKGEERWKKESEK